MKIAGLPWLLNTLGLIFPYSYLSPQVKAFATSRSASMQSRICAGGDHLTQTGAQDEDLPRWERMFFEGNNGGAEKYAFDSSTHGRSSCQVRVVSFDLDNTVWKTGPTIQAANDALTAFLEEERIVLPQSIDKVMGQLFKRCKSTYAPLGGNDPDAPILWTQLRKDALQFVLNTFNGFSEAEAKQFSERAFDVWTTARHEALPKHLASNVLPCLQQIREMQSSSGQPILICAITDGNSDPRKVPLIGEFFDFVVNSESVQVAKPDRRVYLKAIKEAASHPYLSDIFNNVDINDDDALESFVGPWWVHVGDDFLKDIVGAKDLGMRSIWVKELIQETQVGPINNLPMKSVEDFVKEISNKLAESSVIEMAVGTDDYLAETLREEFADSTVLSFEHIATTVVAWHEEGDLTPNLIDEEEPAVVLSIASKENTHASKGNSKFCMECGGKLPVFAKFCSLCGEKVLIE